MNNKPESESLLKPNVPTENVTEINIEESNNRDTPKPAEVSIPLIDRDEERVPPLAQPENDTEDVDYPNGIRGMNDGFSDHEKDDDEIDLADRAGAFPYAPGFGPDGTLSISPESIPDVNIYQHKKTVAQGMMDLALFSANANQLRYVLESSSHSYYYPGIVLISLSLIFQVLVGVGLLWNTRYNVKDEKQICVANKVNNFTVVGIFLVTVINVFISAFGTTAGTTVV